jgi:hypothetical protein
MCYIYVHAGVWCLMMPISRITLYIRAETQMRDVYREERDTYIHSIHHTRFRNKPSNLNPHLKSKTLQPKPKVATDTQHLTVLHAYGMLCYTHTNTQTHKHSLSHTHTQAPNTLTHPTHTHTHTQTTPHTQASSGADDWTQCADPVRSFFLFSFFLLRSSIARADKKYGGTSNLTLLSSGGAT